MTELIVKAGLSYLLGSIVGSLLIGRLKGGVDIRALGSGNAGATNALRTLGRGIAFWVLAIDLAKGFVATRLIAPALLPGIAPAPPALGAWCVTACALAVMLGHVYPLWFGLRGGKGVATLVGAVLGIDPWLLAAMVLTWLAAVVLFGFVGLASMLATLALAVEIAIGNFAPRLPLLAFAVAAAALILYTHRSNIARMRAGTESRARRLWLFGNRGYRIPETSEPLEAAKIRDRLPREDRERVSAIETVWSTSSTNTVLLARANPPVGTSEVLLAEHQSAGRGRRGRAWLAPPGGAICLSLSWTFREVPADIGALSLVVGVCALNALRSQGVRGAALKWPNDLLSEGRKLGGVLIELRAESGGPACVVIGIGLNVALGAALLKRIAGMGLEATDLRSAGLAAPSRNSIAAALVSACLRGLAAFEREGLKPFIEEWRAADALRGRPVAVSGADGTARGLARGVDLHGALLIETREGLRRFIAGDVTVRP